MSIASELPLQFRALNSPTLYRFLLVATGYSHTLNLAPQTDVIVNTIANDLNLTQGAVSSAILKAAGPRLQRAVHSESRDLFSRVVVTDGFNLNCQKVFHAICPAWDSRGGNAMKVRRPRGVWTVVFLGQWFSRF